MSKITRIRGRYLAAIAGALVAMLTLAATVLPAAAQTTPTPTPTATATPTTQTIHLTAGWNLVGWLHGSVAVGDALKGGPNGPANGTNDITSDVDVVWGFDSTTQTWHAYFPSAANIPGANDLTNLQSPNGYFIHVSTAVDWIVAA